jgi:hypothetical protein
MDYDLEYPTHDQKKFYINTYMQTFTLGASTQS